MEILIGVIVTFILLYIVVNSTKVVQVEEFGQQPENQYTDKSQASNDTKADRETTTYKKKQLRNFSIRGLQHRNLSDADTGYFEGNLRSEYNEHDRYAVGIFRVNDDRLLGFVPRGNYKLYNEVSKTKNQQIPCWGSIWFEEYNQWWDGYVNAYVGFDEEEQNTLINLMRVENEILKLCTIS